MICLDDDIAVLVVYSLAGETSGNTILQALDLFLAVHKGLYYHARDFTLALAAVNLTDNQILRYVYHSTGQVTGVRGTQSGIGHTLSSSMR